MAAERKLQPEFEIGPFVVLPDRNILRRDGVDTHLEPKQMNALVALSQHYPAVVNKQQLVDEVWGSRATSDESITGCIKGLRAALDNDNPRKPVFVQTIHGRGYRLMLPPTFPSAPAEKRKVHVHILAAVVLAAAIIGLAVWLPGEDAPDSVQIDSVVITRFVNLGSEASQPIVDGITEQIVSTLYEVPNLQIKKGSLPADNETARDISDRYRVGWVVFGSVQQMNGQVRIVARIDDRDSVVQWAGTFTGSEDQVFALHEQVATKVRDAIRGEEAETVTASSKPQSSDAYDRYLLGQFYLAKRDKASLDQAVEFLRVSITLDPGYGPAYLDLANAYMLLADYGSSERMFDLALATADQGAQHDPGIHDAAQTVYGYVLAKRGQWTASTAAFLIATHSTTEYPPSHHYYSRLLAAVGRVEASLDAAIRAWEMEPDSQVLNSRLAISYFWQNDMDAARRYYEIANTLGAGAPIHQLSYALFLIRNGQLDEAREVTRRAMILLRSDPVWVDPVFDELVNTPASGKLPEVLTTYDEQGVMPANVLMTFWAIAGQADKAMDVARRLVDDPGLLDIELLYLDEFVVLRQHEDFPRLMEQLGLTDYWNNAGCHWSGDKLDCQGY